MLTTHPLRRTLLSAVIAAACLVSMAPGASADTPPDCPRADAPPRALPGKALRRATLCLLNRERVRRGLRPLRANGRLARAARRHARDMVRRSYFSHESLRGTDFVHRIRVTGYLRSVRSWALGENLAWGTQSHATPAAIVRAWMRSPGHRANVLSPGFREIGIGLRRGAPLARTSDGLTYATEF